MSETVRKKWNTSNLSEKDIFEFTFLVEYPDNKANVTLTIEYISMKYSPPIRDTYTFGSSNIVHFDLNINENVFINGYVRLVGSNPYLLAAWGDFHFGYDGYKHFIGTMLTLPAVPEE